jgi:hypothetical protein
MRVIFIFCQYGSAIPSLDAADYTCQLHADDLTFLQPGGPMVTYHDQSPKSSRGFIQLFGLDPRIAFLTFVIDLMIFGGVTLTLGLLIPIALVAGIVLGFIAYRAQMKWYGDDREAALIKGLIVGLLTAIPTPLPAILYVPSGVLGLIHLVRRKWGGLAVRDTNSR